MEQVKETWVSVCCYLGIYEVSEMGRVRSLDRYCRVGGGGVNFVKGRVLQPEIRRGYSILKLCDGGVRKRVFVHRLVADAFVENPEYKPQVNHIDGVKQNNTAANLEWCTAFENVEHAKRLGLYSKRKAA